MGDEAGDPVVEEEPAAPRTQPLVLRQLLRGGRAPTVADTPGERRRGVVAVVPVALLKLALLDRRAR